MSARDNYRIDDTVILEWSSHDSTGASFTATLDAGSIGIYKDGGALTLRAGDSGVTSTIDFNDETGAHMISIDTSDNSDPGFYTRGSRYSVLCVATIDEKTVRFWRSFAIQAGYSPGVLLSTTIATLASQTSFTLATGSTDNDAYNNCPILIEDVLTGTQLAVGAVSDYAGATKTVTLDADPGIFTMAATDRVTILARQVVVLTSGEKSSIAAAVWAHVVENSLTAIQIFRGIWSLIRGKSSGFVASSDSSVAFRDDADTKDRITGTVDAHGNRTAVTIVDLD
jgi:hypothetical protein